MEITFVYLTCVLLKFNSLLLICLLTKEKMYSGNVDKHLSFFSVCAEKGTGHLLVCFQEHAEIDLHVNSKDIARTLYSSPSFFVKLKNIVRIIVSENSSNIYILHIKSLLEVTILFMFSLEQWTWRLQNVCEMTSCHKLCLAFNWTVISMNGYSIFTHLVHWMDDVRHPDSPSWWSGRNERV